MWIGFDELSRAAVAEVTHGASESFHLDRYIAKYGAPHLHHTIGFHLKSENVP